MQLLVYKAAEYAANVISTGRTVFSSKGIVAKVSQVEVGTVLTFPTGINDYEEEEDGTWANTSYWVYCSVEGITQVSIQKKVLHAICPNDCDSNRKGRLVEVEIPDFVVIAVDRAIEEVDSDMEEIQEDVEKGEKVSSLKTVTKVSLFGIQDLDGIVRSCSLKNKGVERMVKVGGMIRLMGEERFGRYVVDLLYSKSEFNETVQRYVLSSVSLPAHSPFRTFVKQPRWKGLPVVDKEDTLERFIMGQYPLLDRTEVSLLEFVRYRR